MKKKLLFKQILFCMLIIGFSVVHAQKKKKSNQKDALTYNESNYDALEYRLLGPFRGGRSSAVTGVPNQPNLFYFGSAGGGVWKTENGGKTWANISDGYFGGSVGAVSVSQSDNNVIYVGGGEKTVRGNVSSGYGVWKSVDKGKTWKQMGLKNSRHIGRVVIHPKNENIALAAVMGNLYKPSSERGVYKTVDGGKSWKKVLFANDNAGAVDLIMDPSNSRVLYASTWRIRRTPYSLESGGEGSALWKSVDGGETWKEISKNKGFAKDTLGIIGVTVSPVNSDRVWALVENKDGGLFRSDDGGETWTLINKSRSLRQRAWYYTRIYADTQNQDIVYVMNVSYHKSTDGGKTFKASNAPHGDHHDLWIAPEDPKRMIIGDDGGAQISYNGGITWSTYYNQPTAQFYRVTTDNHFPYRIYAAQQDNSTIRIKHRSDGRFLTEKEWESTAGGESAHIAIDPNNPEIVYGGSYGGYLTRVNHEKGTSRSINVWPDNPMGHGAEGMKYRFQWNFPIFFSPHNPKKIYTLSNHVHVSENEGQSWKVASPDLTTNTASKLVSSGGPITQDNTGVEYYCTLFAGGESPLKEGLIWVGSDDGLIHLSKDGGNQWTNVTPPTKILPKWSMINSIEPSPFDAGTCYVAATSYKSGDFKPYLYKTSDYGATWKKITNGIPNEHFTRVLRADPKQKGLLYAGTETGMYISFDDGKFWSPFQLNLPIVPITDLAIKDNNLIVATQGRSLWIIDDLSLVHQLNNNVATSSSYLFKPKDVYRMSGSYSKGSLTQGTNHPNGAMVYFNLKNHEEDTEVKLKFSDEKGQEIKTFSTKAEDKKDKLKVKKGANSFIWNMVYPGAKRPEGMILWWGSTNGPKATPGTYKVSLVVGDKTVQEQSFKILRDPRSESTLNDINKQFEFVKGINDKVDETHATLEDIKSVKTTLKSFTEKYKNDNRTEKLREDATSIIDEIKKVEEALYQTKNQSRQDPLNFPIRLNNKLAHLNSLFSGGDFPPTDQAIQVRDELTRAIDVEINKFKTIMNTSIDSFNKKFNSLQLDYLILDEKK